MWDKKWLVSPDYRKKNSSIRYWSKSKKLSFKNESAVSRRGVCYHDNHQGCSNHDQICEGLMFQKSRPHLLSQNLKTWYLSTYSDLLNNISRLFDFVSTPPSPPPKRRAVMLPFLVLIIFGRFPLPAWKVKQLRNVILWKENREYPQRKSSHSPLVSMHG